MLIFILDSTDTLGTTAEQTSPLFKQSSRAQKMSSTTTKTYASGDPRLAIVDDEAEQAPKFDDPYEERKYLKHRLALAFRVFSNFGLAEGVAGHITVRDPVDCNSFWVNPFGMWLVLDRVLPITGMCSVMANGETYP